MNTNKSKNVEISVSTDVMKRVAMLSMTDKNFLRSYTRFVRSYLRSPAKFKSLSKKGNPHVKIIQMDDNYQVLIEGEECFTIVDINRCDEKQEKDTKTSEN